MIARWEPKNTHLSVPESDLPIIDNSVGALTISVKDSGAGISVADQEDLFKEGRQFNANRLQGGAGSGLGLFITMGVVKLHGGVLSSHSDGEGCGSTFSLTLPVVVASEVEGDGVDFDEEAGSIMHNVTENTYEVLQSQGGSIDSVVPLEVAKYPVKSHLKNLSVDVTELNICNVMVVDDSLPSRKMLCRLLKNGGYKCSQAENGQDCVELMVNNRDKSRLGKDVEVQMVFMDYEMPLMNGPEAAKALRDLGFTCPIIGVTGNVLPVDKTYFISMGANDVLSKPLYLDDLNACVRKYSREHTPRGSVTWQPALTSPRAEDVTHALTLHVDDVACDL
jgi:CheY-like chemotaxis protein